jgi:sulfoacetaldehyde dehydrogenase
LGFAALSPTYISFVNITHLVTTIPEDRPSEEALFGTYWQKYGK